MWTYVMILIKFRNYLTSKSFIPNNQLDYYIKWVEHFLQFCPVKKEDLEKTKEMAS